jgi:hypothetical protein
MLFLNKLLIKVLFFFIFYQKINSDLLIKSFNSKFWLTTCLADGCSLQLGSCMSCFGETNCKRCITSLKPECGQCAEDIYNRNDLETVAGNQYLFCDSMDFFQRQICHLFCRGQFAQTGNCIRISNLPICECVFDTM